MTSKVADEIIQEGFEPESKGGESVHRVKIASPADSRGNIEVVVQDQFSEIVDLHLTQQIDTFILNANYSIDDNEISVTSGTLPAVGNIVCLKEDTAFYQGQIISLVVVGGGVYTLTLDMPLDFAYTTSSLGTIETEDLNVDGSSNSQVFRVTPTGLVDPGDNSTPQRWDITRVMFVINDTSAMDDGKFGGITGGLTSGIVVRKKNNIYKNIFNAKTNGDFAAHAYDATYVDDTLGPSGQYGFRCRRTFAGANKNGVTVRLSAGDNDEFQVIVQDDLTSLEKFHVIAQGHVVES